MKKILLMSVLFISSAVANIKVLEKYPEKGTPAEFVVELIKKVNSNSIDFKSFKEFCSNNLIEKTGEGLEGFYKKLVLLDLKERITYFVEEETGYTKVIIKSNLKGQRRIQTFYFNIKKIDDQFKWIDSDRD